MCAVCNGPGRFLCCERCPRSFHFTCLNPPLEEIPEGMWFCNKCTTQHNPPAKPPRGLFSELIDGINRRNPTSFRLPSDIRGYFVGVETGTLGEYVDVRDNKTQRFRYVSFIGCHFVRLWVNSSFFPRHTARVDSWKSMTRTNSRIRRGMPFFVTIAESLPLMANGLFPAIFALLAGIWIVLDRCQCLTLLRPKRSGCVLLMRIGYVLNPC